MDKKIYIFGHKNPDTDSICACISYAHLKRALGNQNVEAVRLGKISKETQFALDYFGVKAPRLLENIKPQVSDMNFYNVPSVYVVDSVKKAWDVMTENGRQMIPVLYHDHKLAGVISVSDIAKTYIGLTDGCVLKNHKTPFINVASVLDGKVITGSYPHAYVLGDVYTTASIDDHTVLADTDIIITGPSSDRIQKALNSGAGAVIITDQNMDNLKLELPPNLSCAVICTPYSFFKTIKMVSQSISVKNILKKDDITYFETDDYLDEVKQVMLNTSYRHFPILDQEGLVKGLISKRHLLDIQKKKVILVDHNERSQSADGIEQAEILEIIDHHRIANIDTGNPLFLRAEPVGCTNTIIGKMFEEKNIMPPKEIAGIMLSAILSDTLIFKSPTCTPDDVRIAKRLAEIAEVDLYAYGAELLAAGTSLEGTSPAELLNIDRKAFTVGKYNISVAQVNTGDFKSLFKIKDQILEEMHHLEEKENLDLCLLMVTDIVVGGTELMVTGREKRLAEALFGLDPTDDSIFLKDVFSRKKQIVPKLMGLS
ncbi:putative manganese-dependent inorganic diphosphatase [Cellulosilyticum sp. ST5]|uniref:inorganic diphosphatase n=1 Tax=Cellulosilyticum lentocellum (strain ATCC 49066 / DSM 5427 / NCIMB 11756 / RHM5) TaxID=642492 RepID=F2JS01_CELLD|nr:MULTISPECIES: putative manganese-dependent inorganic diphosphatase [Cellulosilyticum]ADZ82815.1 Inorganic diphosphatase [Cellulosilyticum lentocellum DSM 5427]QEH68357.1 putative manganese-dependent inorganic diphosphatase [Cellulosilyticum sp. WCF-2]